MAEKSDSKSKSCNKSQIKVSGTPEQFLYVKETLRTYFNTCIKIPSCGGKLIITFNIIHSTILCL